MKAGDGVVVYDCEGVTVGCSICYDLRFPDLFQALAEKGAQVIALPAAFTLQTGKDHWEVLLRARAIETQTYLCASAQTGSFTVGNEQRSTVRAPRPDVLVQVIGGVGGASGQPGGGTADFVTAGSRGHVSQHIDDRSGRNEERWFERCLVRREQAEDRYGSNGEDDQGSNLGSWPVQMHDCDG